MIDDFDLIVSSFKSEYGVSLYSDEFRKMTWKEFCVLLTGLGEDTPLVSVVRIRLEDDPDVLKRFSEAQHRIRNKWRAKHSGVNKDENAHLQFLTQMQNYFANS